MRMCLVSFIEVNGNGPVLWSMRMIAQQLVVADLLSAKGANHLAAWGSAPGNRIKKCLSR